MLDSVAHPVIFQPPRYLSDMWYWQGHIPFAFWCIAQLQPRIFVELGTHKGDSFFAFCQAVDYLNSKTKCYAIDTWEGDDHAGHYSDSVYTSVKAYSEEYYPDISVLIRSTFAEAVEKFSDEEIDLLHIDGFHTYEAAKEDFDSYRNKISERGVVLFHDIAVRERGFGVWKYWDEMKKIYPSFEFVHSHGLGVLLVGKNVPDLFNKIASASDSDQESIQDVFSSVGEQYAFKTRVELLFKSSNEELAVTQDVVKDRDEFIRYLEGAVKCRDEELAVTRQVVEERDEFISYLEGCVKSRDDEIISLSSRLNLIQNSKAYWLINLFGGLKDLK